MTVSVLCCHGPPSLMSLQEKWQFVSVCWHHVTTRHHFCPLHQLMIKKCLTFTLCWCICICVFVFVHLYLCICICTIVFIVYVFVFVYLYLCICICVFAFERLRRLSKWIHRLLKAGNLSPFDSLSEMVGIKRRTE